VGAKLKPQFFSQRLALLEAREELVEEADDDCVDTDAFGFGPVFELGTGFGSDVEELGISQVHTGFAGLLNIHFILVHVA